MSTAIDRTLGEILAGEPKNRSSVELAQLMKRLGYSDDYRIRHNTYLYGLSVAHWCPGIKGADLVWLCNQLCSAYQKIEAAGCVDNLRACHSGLVTHKPNPHYVEAQSQGCCGSYDEEVVNPRTKKRFWIGFNYGH